MEKLNMANMNTLFKKGYLLAGVIMAANMFVVNEMKASSKPEQGIPQINSQRKSGQINPNELSGEFLIDSKKKLKKDNLQMSQGSGSIKLKGKNKDGKVKKSSEKGFFNFLLSYENLINLIGGLALSGANNYFKWWDYNAGGYLNLRIGCLGWRSKRLLDIFQFEVNLNGIRGALWLIPGAYNFIKSITKDNGKDYAKPLHVSFLVYNLFDDETSVWPLIAFIGVFLLQGFVSMPLTLHFSKFSISISLDSMIWAVIGHILGKNDRGMKNSDPNLINNPHMNPIPTINEENIMLNDPSQSKKEEEKKKKK